MQSWAAIDILGGRVVSLLKGEPSASTDWGISPVAAARRWEREGADGLHLVDLDRAFGSRSNENIVREILEEVKLPVQVGGGIRSAVEALRLLKMGAARVVLGTLAYDSPEVLRDLVDRAGANSIVVAADHREGRVLTHGWRKEGGMDLFEAAEYVEGMGISRLLVTATERDGAASGPDLGTYRRLSSATRMSILASGGIRTKEDLKKLGGIGLEGAILGRALYDGSVKLTELRRTVA